MSLTPKILSFAVMMAIGGTAAAAKSDLSAIDRAHGLLKANAAQARASAHDRFIAGKVVVDADGTEHVRFDRSYNGLRVIGGDLIVHSRNGRLQSTTLTQDAPLRLSTRARVKAADAVVSAGAEFAGSFSALPSSELVVYAREKGAPKLAYQVRIAGAGKDGHELDMSYIVNASNGKVVDRWSNNHYASAPATFKTRYSGNVAATTNSVAGGFELRDPSRGNGFTISGANGRTSGKIYLDTDNVWGNNLDSDVATFAADAQYGVGVTWDYFKNVHARNGIANDGKGAYNRVHYGRNYVNAFWSDACFCMTFGDGDASAGYGPLVNLDIAGHEMTHGVTSRTADLIYSGESGGLNEATSDIFGTMVEFYANNPTDTPDYLIGEKIYLANGSTSARALRYMHKPSLDNRSPNCWSGAVAGLDVHYSSGPANHFFYLLSEGTGAKSFSGVDHTSPVCAGGALAGIGRDKAAKIWYRALTVGFTTNTNYAGARVATLAAAAFLYGGASAEYNAVAATWTAVGVN